MMHQQQKQQEETQLPAVTLAHLVWGGMTLLIGTGITLIGQYGQNGYALSFILAVMVGICAPILQGVWKQVSGLGEQARGLLPTREVPVLQGNDEQDNAEDEYEEDEPEEDAQEALPRYQPERPKQTRLLDDEEMIAPPSRSQKPIEEEYHPPVDFTNFTFSRVLSGIAPSLDLIYLATLSDGTPVFSDARGLCHVALAGSTGQGKSNLIRLLMSQLCHAGASVLLLNPHYTRYDLERDEDWTPFEPYLVYDPMECRKYDVIEHYLKYVAMTLLPRRLEKYSQSQPLGKPYFIVMDELPAIVEHIPDAPKYLAAILREGRKVGIFLMTAAQDFLVKTIAPQGGGAIRDCYRTSFYTGGDSTTAKVLLDTVPNQIPENILGKGLAMLRCISMKVASLVHIPYVDNKALYRLLGPSTYTPTETYHLPEDDLVHPGSQSAALQQSIAEVRTSNLPAHLQRALEVYRPNMSYRELGEKLGVGKDTAGKWLMQLKERRLLN